MGVGNSGECYESTLHRQGLWLWNCRGSKASREQKTDDTGACSVLAGFCGQESVGNIAVKRAINPYDLDRLRTTALITSLCPALHQQRTSFYKEEVENPLCSQQKLEGEEAHCVLTLFFGFSFHFASSSIGWHTFLVSSMTYVQSSGLSSSDHIPTMSPSQLLHFSYTFAFLIQTISFLFFLFLFLFCWGFSPHGFHLCACLLGTDITNWFHIMHTGQPKYIFLSLDIGFGH